MFSFGRRRCTAASCGANGGRSGAKRLAAVTIKACKGTQDRLGPLEGRRSFGSGTRCSACVLAQTAEAGALVARITLPAPALGGSQTGFGPTTGQVAGSGVSDVSCFAGLVSVFQVTSAGVIEAKTKDFLSRRCLRDLITLGRYSDAAACAVRARNRSAAKGKTVRPRCAIFWLDIDEMRWIQKTQRTISGRLLVLAQSKESSPRKRDKSCRANRSRALCAGGRRASHAYQNQTHWANESTPNGSRSAKTVSPKLSIIVIIRNTLDTFTQA